MNKKISKKNFKKKYSTNFFSQGLDYIVCEATELSPNTILYVPPSGQFKTYELEVEVKIRSWSTDSWRNILTVGRDRNAEELLKWERNPALFLLPGNENFIQIRTNLNGDSNEKTGLNGIQLNQKGCLLLYSLLNHNTKGPK